jgi:hypothetical protein
LLVNRRAHYVCANIGRITSDARDPSKKTDKMTETIEVVGAMLQGYVTYGSLEPTGAVLFYNTYLPFVPSTD